MEDSVSVWNCLLLPLLLNDVNRYSGDTRPCNKLIDHGQNATLLIHEATFDDIEKEKAIDKRHSTTGEAVDVGQRYIYKLNHN